MMHRVTDVFYEPKHAVASCEGCEWEDDGEERKVRRLSRQHTSETEHPTTVISVQKIRYKRETIGA